MNARQKAKKYKRMYESLSARSKPPITFKEEQYEIDTLKFWIPLPRQYGIFNNDRYIRRIVIDNIAEELAKCPEKYIDWYVEELPFETTPRLHYQIKVLRKKVNNDNNNT